MADHRKILAVFGATGVQGGSLLRTVTTHPKLNGTHKVRALTRDASKTSAASLASQDVEVVQVMAPHISFAFERLTLSDRPKQRRLFKSRTTEC